MEKVIAKYKQIKIIQIFTILLRYVLGMAFVYASIFKIMGIRFTPQSAEKAPIDSLPHLFETMFRLGFYWQFIGWGQLIVGFLLMSQIFSTLGAVAFFPLMLNIFIFTIYFNSPMILAITFLMLLANIYLLLWDWSKLKFIVLPNPNSYVSSTNEFSRNRIWTYLGVILFIFTVIFRFYNL